MCKNCVRQQNSKVSSASENQLIYIRYLDHVLFKDIDAQTMKPQIRETVGWLAEESEDHIRIEWERFADEHDETEHRVEPYPLVRRCAC